VREQARNERLREERATALFHLTGALAEAKTLDEAVFSALRQTDHLFKAKTSLVLADDSGTLIPHFASSYTLDDKERGVIEWAYRNSRPAGRFTDTLPGSSAHYLPLRATGRCWGTWRATRSRNGLTLVQRDLLETFGRQLAMVIEREDLREASEREKLLAESEKLHRTLLDSVSHELRTPLAVITASAENMLQADEKCARI